MLRQIKDLDEGEALSRFEPAANMAINLTSRRFVKGSQRVRVGSPTHYGYLERHVILGHCRCFDAGCELGGIAAPRGEAKG
jgi:hypothetical protein